MKITETTPKVTPPPRTFSIELTHNQLKLLAIIVGHTVPDNVKIDIANSKFRGGLYDAEYENICDMYEFLAEAAKKPAP